MIYSPSQTLNMGDTWIFEHEGQFYLYTLIASKGEKWDCIGLAVSEDLTHWHERGIVLESRPNIDYMGSGHTWETNGRFMMNFSECVEGIQTIYFAESDDLFNWRRLGDEFACEADSRWYQVEKEPNYPEPRWDCIWVMPRENEKGFIGFLSATAAEGEKRGVAGCVTSEDGVRFNPVPPVSPPDLVETLEVNAVERIGNLYYMVDNDFYFLIADNQAGPYELPDGDNKLYPPSPFVSFGRFFKLDEELLFNHHCIPRADEDRNSFGTLKKVQEIEPGKIILKYWQGNATLRGEQITVDKSQNSIQEVQHFFGRDKHTAYRMDYFDIADLDDTGLIIEAEVELQKEEPDAFVGLYFGDKLTGTAFFVYTDGKVEFGQMLPLTDSPHHPDGEELFSFKPEHEVPWKKQEGVPIQMRVLVRNSFLELYLDDVFVQCYSMFQSLKGGVSFVAEGGRTSLEDLKIYRMNL